ncbi:hypothetical protein HO173_012618 [Letharia columbiana]|uniref:Uncharacterized protein n=1 Tax=Letharia columbiana TaxID=112416 RepID=A0A8H6CM13_9LECA|nr:uncharacterized protein HO173_012618 [Letharia columbiana]KAF6225988.1 hypothetical protein HO173_012618 [Letharia columbiana]
MFRLRFLVALLRLCISVLAAPLSSTPSLGLLNGKTLNLAPPTNLSLHDQPNLGVLPSDPLFRHIPGSTVTITFRNYTITISRLDSKRCVEAALGDVLTHGDRRYTKVNTPREYAWGTVELSILPEDAMRWVELSHLVQSIQAWLKVYDSVDMNFDVLVDGVGRVGTGRLANVI